MLSLLVVEDLMQQEHPFVGRDSQELETPKQHSLKCFAHEHQTTLYYWSDTERFFPGVKWDTYCHFLAYTSV